MPWAVWNTLAAFTTWHDAKCVTVGIPFPSRRATHPTLTADDLAQAWTQAYVQPYQILPAGQIIALVTAADITTDHLTPLVGFIPDTETLGATPNVVALTVQLKPKPATWLIDGVPTPVP